MSYCVITFPCASVRCQQLSINSHYSVPCIGRAFSRIRQRNVQLVSCSRLSRRAFSQHSYEIFPPPPAFHFRAGLTTDTLRRALPTSQYSCTSFLSLFLAENGSCSSSPALLLCLLANYNVRSTNVLLTVCLAAHLVWTWQRAAPLDFVHRDGADWGLLRVRVSYWHGL